MSKTLQKTLASLMAAAMLVSGSALLTACKSSGTGDATDATVELTAEGGSSTAAAPTPLPSMFEGTMTINGESITAAEYDFYYYNLYNNYAQYVSYGYVPTTAEGEFDLTAACGITGYEDTPWGDYIKIATQKQIQDSYILAYNAEQAGVALTADSQSVIDSFLSNVDSYAASYNMTADEYLTTLYGDAATKQSLEPVVNRYMLANQYMTSLSGSFTFTDDELQTYYTANADSYSNTDLPIVRHILFMAPKGVDGYTDATEEEIADAKALAEAALAKITSYDTMVSVGAAALADGSASESTEYTVDKGDMVTEFENWCYDAARKSGDTGIIQTEYGFHVMYFVGTEKDWMADAKDSLSSDKMNAYLAEQEALPLFAVTVG